MTRDERDAEFVSALERDRADLQGTAFLLLDDPTSAARLLEATLAELYAQGLAPVALRRETLRRLVRDDAQPTLLPWSRARQFELVDGAPPAKTGRIEADLARLPRDQRTVIVLEQFTGLSDVQIADVLDQPVAEVQRLGERARAALTTAPAERAPDGRLAEKDLAAELRSAVPYDWRTARAAAADVDHGRRLIRRRRLRRGAGVVAAMVALIAVVSQLWPQPAPPPPVALAPSVGPTPLIQARCDVSDPTCQTAVLEDWRTEMARIVNTHLEPGQQTSFGFDPSATTPTTFWSGQGGALDLDLLRLDQSGTQVSLQIASSSEFAQVCGATTRTTCTTTRYMDGNRFTISDSRPDRGIEVQYSPYGDQVITAIVRRIGPGKARDGAELPVSRGDLVDLLQDRRLRLPGL